MAGQAIVPASAAELSRADYEACQAQDENALHGTIATISGGSLKTALAKVNVRDLVQDAWLRNNLDEIIAKRVDTAIEDVKSQSTWTELLSSLANAQTAQKLATAAAERVYRSDSVKTAIEALATDTAKDIGKSIELASADAAGPILNCLKAFVGTRYGSAIAVAVAGDAGKDVVVDSDQATGNVTTTSMLKQTSGGLAGVTILIVRRQLGNLATRVGQRIAGSVLSRLVSVVAGGIGLALIAKDVWQLRHGVLPIIASEMNSRSTKDKVKDEIALTLQEQVSTHLDEIATTTADNVIGIWRAFKQAHALVVKLVDQDAAFKAFADTTRPAFLPRLDEVVALIAASEGEGGVLQRLQTGMLNQAVNVMPVEGMDIARDTGSIPAALEWTSLAGDKLKSVVDYEIHRHAPAHDFTKVSLERLINLGDRTAIVRLASVPKTVRATLFDLEPAKLESLTKGLGEQDLTTLSSYLTGLQAGPRERVLAAVSENPQRMLDLGSARVRDSIVGSRDQAAAVDMMMRPAQGLEPRVFLNDAVLIWNGRVAPWLIWEKHPVGTVLSGLLILLLLGWLKRLFLPPPRRGSAPETA